MLLIPIFWPEKMGLIHLGFDTALTKT